MSGGAETERRQESAALCRFLGIRGRLGAERLMMLTDGLACCLSTPTFVALAHTDDEMADAPCLAVIDAELWADESDSDADEANDAALMT